MPRVPVVQLSGAVDRATAFVTENPALAVALIVLVLVSLAVATLLIRRYLRPPGVRFERAIADVERISILMHPDPDPDAMAAAFATELIADRVGTEHELWYAGQIGHENRAFLNVLEMQADPIDSASDLAGEVVLVDHNQPRGEFHGVESITPYAVVDHHPGDGTGTEHTDVRPEYGACATIFAAYADDVGLVAAGNGADDVDPEDRLPSPVAAGLMYGILTDTENLTKGCSPAEFSASAYLYDAVDRSLLDRIANPAVDAEVLDVKAEAIREYELRAPFAVADVGSVSNTDAIPQAADELLGLEGVQAVVVLGDKDGTLHVSGRSQDDRVHMGNTLAAVVEDIPMADAGGHARMGGGQLSIPHMQGLREDSGVSRDEFTQLVFDALSGEV